MFASGAHHMCRKLGRNACESCRKQHSSLSSSRGMQSTSAAMCYAFLKHPGCLHVWRETRELPDLDLAATAEDNSDVNIMVVC